MEINKMNRSMERDMQYLSAKRTSLAAQGTVLDNNYYTPMNSTVQLVETTYSCGRLAMSLTSKGFGSQSQVIIPNSSFIGDTYLVLTLPNILPNQTLSRGWGYAILNNISYLFGSSNISQLQINGQSLWHKISMQCDTEEKRSALFELGGQEVLSPITYVDPIDGIVKRDPYAVLTATVLLPFPWSSASGLFSKLPFDSNCINNPITIQMQFNQGFTIYGGTAVKPEGFLDAQCLFVTGDLTNKDQSLRRDLELNPQLSMMYPFIHTQSLTPTTFAGSSYKQAGGPQPPISIPLTSFINADLLAITVCVIRSDLLTPLANGSPSVFCYDNIQNVRLLYNGTVLFNAPYDSFKAMTMRSNMGAQCYKNSLIKPHSGVGPFDSVPIDSYPLHIDFSRIRSTTFEGQFQNTFRLGQQVLTLEFNTEGGADVRYQMFCTYHYNAVAQCQQGMTSIYFD
jgi:hypothetical protein